MTIQDREEQANQIVDCVEAIKACIGEASSERLVERLRTLSPDELLEFRAELRNLLGYLGLQEVALQ